MTMNPPEFERVKLHTYEPCQASPDVSEDFRGLAIRAPSSITLGGRLTFPVCGIYQVTAAFLGRFESMENQIVIVAVDAKEHIPRSTNLLPEGFTPGSSGGGPGSSDEPAQRLERTILKGWFNVDLFRFLPDLPRDAATYHVFSTVGDVSSNVVTVSLVPA
jgi:hypothetical protein